MNTGCPTCPDRMLEPPATAAQSPLRSALIAVAGGGLLCLGVVGLFLPLPGVVLIAMGLSLLGTRFPLARRWLDGMKQTVARLRVGKR